MTGSGQSDTRTNAAWELGAIARAAQQFSDLEILTNPYRRGTALASEWAAGWAHEDREIKEGR